MTKITFFKEEKKKNINYSICGLFLWNIYTLEILRNIFKGIWSFNLEITGTLFFYGFSYHQNWLSITWRSSVFKCVPNSIDKRNVGDFLWDCTHWEPSNPLRSQSEFGVISCTVSILFSFSMWKNIFSIYVQKERLILSNGGGQLLVSPCVKLWPKHLLMMDFTSFDCF